MTFYYFLVSSSSSACIFDFNSVHIALATACCHAVCCLMSLSTCSCLIIIYVLKNYRFEHTCNDDSDIGHSKQQKIACHIFTCKFSVSYITMSADHDNNYYCHIQVRVTVKFLVIH